MLTEHLYGFRLDMNGQWLPKSDGWTMHTATEYAALFTEGFEAAYDKGYEERYEDNYKKGFADGKGQGYAEGYETAEADFLKRVQRTPAPEAAPPTPRVIPIRRAD